MTTHPQPGEWASADAVVDAASLIDKGPISPLQWRVFALCGLVALLDGADNQSIGIAGPLIATKLGVVASAFTPAYSAALVGATIGALTFGPLGDWLGRKRLLVTATLFFSVFTILTATVDSFGELLLVRFLGGIGLGGATPCFITLTAEYSPKRYRAMLTSVMWAAYPLGASLGGVLNAYLLERLGWQAMFYIGGVLPLVVAALLVLLLPESIGFLLTRSGHSARALAIARKLDPALPAKNLRLVLAEERPAGVPFKNLFTQGRAAATILLWLMFFAVFGTTTVITLLTPTLFRSAGIPLSTAALMVGLYNLSGVVGMASAGRLIEKFGPLVLVPALWIGSILLVVLGRASSSVAVSAICMGLLGLTVLVGASGAIALVATTYPTSMRSSGVGWAMGMGRLGQVCSPLMVGAMLGLSWQTPAILGLIAALPLLAGLLCIVRVWFGSARDGGAAGAPS